MSTFFLPILLVSVSILLLTFCASATPDFDNNTYNVVCNTRSYWAFVPISSSLVSSWLPSGVSLSSHPFNLSADVFPIYLEFNQQADCYVVSLPAFKQTMLEFKVEMPYLRQDGLAGPLMFKPLIYENNELEVAGTKAQYGLNCYLAQHMEMNNDTGYYAVIGNENKGLLATFKPVSDWTPILQADFASFFVSLNDATEWLGHNILQQQKCAKDYYVWEQTKVRQVVGQIHFDAGFLINDQQAYDYTVPENNGGMTAIQIDTILHITTLEECSKANEDDRSAF